MLNFGGGYIRFVVCFSSTAECYGVFARYRFRRVLGELGRFREETGFRESFDGFWQVRFCSRGLDGTGSGNRVPGTKGIKKVPDSGDSVPKGPKVTLYFESILLYFESVRLHSGCILLYFESIRLYFESILLYFESILLYFDSSCFVLWKGTFTLRKYTYFVLWNGTFVLWKLSLYFGIILLNFENILLYFENVLLYFESILLYFESILLYFESIIILYFDKEKVVINIYFKDASLFAVGDTTYAYWCFFLPRRDAIKSSTSYSKLVYMRSLPKHLGIIKRIGMLMLWPLRTRLTR